MGRTDVKLTYDDYRLFPENGLRRQLVDGERITSPAPSTRHQQIVMNLGFALRAWADRGAGGRVLVAPLDVILSEVDVVQPDVLWVQPRREGIVKDEGLRGAPDLVVEVLSPSTAALDRNAKRRLYARGGVAELWIVDPDPETVEVYSLQADPERPVLSLDRDGQLISALLPGFAAEGAEIFRMK